MHRTEGISIGAFGAIFVAATNRVLMVQLGDYAAKNIGGNPWTLPGGGVSAREAPQEAVCREIKEETGVSFEPKGLTLAAWIARPYVQRGDARGEVTLLFVGESQELATRPAEPEILKCAWQPFLMEQWLEVPATGSGEHSLQPLRRHWIYWTYFGDLKRKQAGSKVPILLYPSPQSMGQEPHLFQPIDGFLSQSNTFTKRK
ncbi:MAG: NUDIX hydrolase [Planctomycetota bacterium]